MKKIPTLFERIYENHKIIGIRDVITPGCEEAFLHGEATIKYDGACCSIIDGEMYKRYDAKKGKTPPEGAIPCCDPDPVTGHWPHWVKVDENNPADKWFIEAFKNSYAACGKFKFMLNNSGDTFEAVGPHFQGNPYHLSEDKLFKHGNICIRNLTRDFEHVGQWLNENTVEGIVFWLDGAPVCKIKRSDFGYEWPVKEATDA